MPIYEFRCQHCEHRFQKLCSLGENGENITCPSCKTANPKRVMSGFTLNNPGALVGSRGDSCRGCTSSNCEGCRN